MVASPGFLLLGPQPLMHGLEPHLVHPGHPAVQLVPGSVFSVFGFSGGTIGLEAL